MPYKCDGITCNARHDVVVGMGCFVPTHGSNCWHVDKRSKSYEAEARLLSYDFFRDLENIAQRAQAAVVIPFCDKNRLRFHNGLGPGVYRWCMTRLDEGPNDRINSHNWDRYLDNIDPPHPMHSKAINRPPEGYAIVRSVLSTVLRVGALVNYMDDYSPPERGDSEKRSE